MCVLLLGSASQAPCDNPDYPHHRPVLLEEERGGKSALRMEIDDQ